MNGSDDKSINMNGYLDWFFVKGKSDLHHAQHHFV